MLGLLLGDLLLAVLELGEGEFLSLDLLEVGLELLEGVLGGNPGEAVDLALADPDPLRAEIPAEAEPVDVDGVCDCLGRSELGGLLCGGYSSPPYYPPRVIPRVREA